MVDAVIIGAGLAGLSCALELVDRVGGFNGGMTEVMIEPIARAIENKGGLIRNDAKVTKLLVQEGRVIGVGVNGEELLSRNVVLATSLKPAQELLAPHFAGLP
jgi:15-cis-phytoene desaturase